MKFSASSSSIDDDKLNSSRLENLHWCTCHHCTVMPTFIECKCCEEFPDLLKDKLDDACITDHKDFDVLCLQISVLETAFIRHHHYKNNYTDAKEMTKNTVFFPFSSQLKFIFHKTTTTIKFSQNNVCVFSNSCYMVSTRLSILNILCLTFIQFT